MSISLLGLNHSPKLGGDREAEIRNTVSVDGVRNGEGFPLISLVWERRKLPQRVRRAEPWPKKVLLVAKTLRTSLIFIT